MPQSQDGDKITLVAVQRNIAAVAKVDRQLPVFRLHVIGWPTYPRILSKNLNGLGDGNSGTLCRCGIL